MSTTRPVTKKPITTRPVTTRPVTTTRPITTRPVTKKPATIQNNVIAAQQLSVQGNVNENTTTTTRPVTRRPTPTPNTNTHNILLSSYTNLLNKVKQQNSKILSQIEEYDHIHSTNYTDSVYESESAENLQVVYNYLFYIYYSIAFLFILFVIFKFGLFTIHSILMILIVLFFPFIIIPVENFLKNGFLYIYSFLYISPFQKSDI